MKKILCSLLLMAFTILPVNVFAAGYISVSPTTITVTEGSTKTITITAYNAIGDVRVKSNNTGVATVNPGSWTTGSIDSGITKKGTITVKGIKEGTTTITFTIDGATFDGGDLEGQVKTVNVNVIEKKLEKKSIDNGPSEAYSDVNTAVPKLSEQEQAIVYALRSGERLVDDVIAETGLTTGKILALLTMLELKGVVKRLPGKRITLK